MLIALIEIGNFRKLKEVRISISKEETVFVGANNSGKTSAMVAIRNFLVERERSKFSLTDFTLSHWPKIDEMGKAWEETTSSDEKLPAQIWSPMLPFLDVWLSVEINEVHLVQQIIPTLDWDGGHLGVRLRFEPKDTEQLKKDYLSARIEAKSIEDLANNGTKSTTQQRQSLVIWPNSLTDFVQRRFSSLFTVRSYILDPKKLTKPELCVAKPQILSEDTFPIEGDPFAGLIRIDEISAQRGFGNTDGTLATDENPLSARPAATRKLSDQLKKYWNKHLDPFENPDAKDINALTAIQQAQKAFDDRLREGFEAALKEVEGLGYPGVTDPQLKISTRLKPVDGLNHDAAVQYILRAAEGDDFIDLNLPEDSNGLGYQNLISMVFRLMSFRDAWLRVGKAASKNCSENIINIPPLHIVLIEEPEAYLHTQVQQVFIRQAYKILRNNPELNKPKSALKTQMIVSTHSSHIALECEFESLRYFRRLPARCSCVPISIVVNLENVFGNDYDTKRFVTRYIKVTHCDLLFADAAVLVEGPAERMLIPFFVKNNEQLHELHECYVAWLEIGGSHAHRFRNLIEHLGLTTLVITDIDAKDDTGNVVMPARGKLYKSRNATLKAWWPVKDDIDSLIDLKPQDKIKEDNDRCFSIRVAYQCPKFIDFNGMHTEAFANTLEDALVMENLDFFKNSAGKGLLSKFKSAINESSTIDDLSHRLLTSLKTGSKAEFALDILEVENPNDIKPPQYIADGLIWLSNQLKVRQRDLGVAPANSNPACKNRDKSE